MWINSCAVVHPDIRPKMIMTISKKRPTATDTSIAKIPTAKRARKRIFLIIIVRFIGWGCRGRAPPAGKLFTQFPFIPGCVKIVFLEIIFGIICPWHFYPVKHFHHLIHFLFFVPIEIHSELNGKMSVVNPDIACRVFGNYEEKHRRCILQASLSGKFLFHS